MMRPFRMMVAFMSGERTLVACWSPHPAATNFCPTSPQCLLVLMMSKFVTRESFRSHQHSE
jgi:hypothetical protein